MLFENHFDNFLATGVNKFYTGCEASMPKRAPQNSQNVNHAKNILQESPHFMITAIGKIFTSEMPFCPLPYRKVSLPSVKASSNSALFTAGMPSYAWGTVHRISLQ